MTPGAVGKPARSLDIAVLGATGRVGSRVLDLIAAREPAWRAAGCRPRIVALANSRLALSDCDGIEPSAAAAQLRAAGHPRPTGPALGDSLSHPPPQIILDCTASAEVAAQYPRWLAAGSDIVTPNKHAPSGDRPLYHATVAAQAASGARLYDGTTVGAQLPLLETLRDLHRAGDSVERFEAVLSGTLSYVLGCINRGAALSASVREAVQTGYAEPNPACDLSGEDAARKLVILLRALGHDVELGDVDVTPLVDAALLQAEDAARLLAGLEAGDAPWRARAALAEARHERWVFRASWENGRARVAPERVPDQHAFARLAPCENALVLHSAFYRAAPLTIAGPGAGIDLTAAGVFADLIAAAHRRAAPANYDIALRAEAA